MRPGEILALQRRHIATDCKSLVIDQRLYRGDIDTPKTKTSARKVAIPPKTASHLKDWMELVGSKPEAFRSGCEGRFSTDSRYCHGRSGRTALLAPRNALSIPNRGNFTAMDKSTPNDGSSVNRLVGRRIRLARIDKGWPMEALGDTLAWAISRSRNTSWAAMPSALEAPGDFAEPRRSGGVLLR